LTRRKRKVVTHRAIGFVHLYECISKAATIVIFNRNFIFSTGRLNNKITLFLSKERRPISRKTAVRDYHKPSYSIFIVGIPLIVYFLLGNISVRKDPMASICWSMSSIIDDKRFKLVWSKKASYSFQGFILWALFFYDKLKNFKVFAIQ